MKGSNAVNQSGRAITLADVEKYKGVVCSLIMKYFPKRRCAEASMEYEDLVSEIMIVVWDALISFDDNVAIETVSTRNPEKKKWFETDEQYLKYKSENRDEALANNELRWVIRAAWMRLSEIYKESGSTSNRNRTQLVEDIDIKLQKAAKTGNLSLAWCFNGSNSPDINLMNESINKEINIKQTQIDVEYLQEVVKKRGRAYAYDRYLKLSPERQRDLKEYCILASLQFSLIISE